MSEQASGALVILAWALLLGVGPLLLGTEVWRRYAGQRAQAKKEVAVVSERKEYFNAAVQGQEAERACEVERVEARIKGLDRDIAEVAALGAWGASARNWVRERNELLANLAALRGTSGGFPDGPMRVLGGPAPRRILNGPFLHGGSAGRKILRAAPTSPWKAWAPELTEPGSLLERVRARWRRWTVRRPTADAGQWVSTTRVRLSLLDRLMVVLGSDVVVESHVPYGTDLNHEQVAAALGALRSRSWTEPRP